MLQYLDLVKHVLENGTEKPDRTGTGTISSFGHQLRFDLKEEFPIVKAKFTGFKTMLKELLWFISGDTNINKLLEVNCHIWDEWADENGDLGPVYGAQWRKWKSIEVVIAEDVIDHGNGKTYFNAKVKEHYIDQLQQAIDLLKTDPFSRRIIVSAWNVSDLSKMALMPCHNFFQFNVRYKSANELRDEYALRTGQQIRGILNREQWLAEFEKNEMRVRDKYLSLMWNQRSIDIGLGLPFNIASYATLCHMVAQLVDMDVDILIGNFGDVHVYKNHVDGMKEMLSRPIITSKAKLHINENVTSIDDFELSDFSLLNYDFHPKIDLPVAV
jgi:thymidylate synthase